MNEEIEVLDLENESEINEEIEVNNSVPEENIINTNDISNNKETIEEQEKEKLPLKKKKKNIIAIFIKFIIRLFLLLITIIIILEAVIGVLSINKISNNEEPVWYLNKTENNVNDENILEYDLGLYRIVKTDSPTKQVITLKPFFLKS